MGMNVGKEVARLRRMTVAELRGEYAKVTGEETRCRHKDYLVRRIAWRLQANIEGGLSERACRQTQIRKGRARSERRWNGFGSDCSRRGQTGARGSR